MEKKDLKTGMRVVTRNGISYIVLINDYDGFNGNDSMVAAVTDAFPLNSFKTDLTSCIKEDYDIVKVYDIPNKYSLKNMLSPQNKGDLLWNRKNQIIFKEFIESKGIDWGKFKENCEIVNQRWTSKTFYNEWENYIKLTPHDWLTIAFSWEYNILNKTTKELDNINSEWRNLIKNVNDENIKFE